jgi:zinc D-Ala-D-Ala dipeptidase
MRGWQEVPLEPIDEPLVCLESGRRLLVTSIYWQRGHREASAEVYVRSRVAERLRDASELLPPSLLLLVLDGWRPLKLQESLHRAYATALSDSTGLLGDELARALGRFVTEPSGDPRCPSPHLTGGAVDLTLASSDGVALDMGSEFDELSARSRTDYYEQLGRPAGEVEIRDRRRLLCEVMTRSGFCNYPEEWWHFDLGNQFWGLLQRQIAYYGKITPTGGDDDG